MIARSGWDAAIGSVARRRFLMTAGASGLTALASACCTRPFATAMIHGNPPATTATPLKPVVRTWAGRPEHCIDVHAHFFNASDVPVKGYLAGPVAEGFDEPLKSLLRALAPVAEQLAEIAPSAESEYGQLLSLAASPEMREHASAELALESVAMRWRSETAGRFFELVRGTSFHTQYDAIKLEQRRRLGGFIAGDVQHELDARSMAEAMQSGSQPNLARSPLEIEKARKETYPDGVLAFVGYMLSYRWMNLRAYSQAYSSSAGAFGIDMTLGALVDFDHWLDCPPRSAQDDQVKLHQLLSELSGGYMRPLVAYNPWSDIVADGAATRRVIDAVKNRGFVGVKIYPPNGFRPFGNAKHPIDSVRGAPSPADLDKALQRFWDACIELDVPVMAHTGETMGANASDVEAGGPTGWQALYDQYAGHASPRANLGHFGGDEAHNDWTLGFAKLMTQREASTLYGDVAYWSLLRCADPAVAACSGHARLQDALKLPGVSKRVMYGTDWLMLSQVRDWARYPFDIAASTADLISQDDLFGLNARRCFPKLT